MSTRSELIRSLVEPELGQQLRRAAEEQDRSLSYTVRAILAEWASGGSRARSKRHDHASADFGSDTKFASDRDHGQGGRRDA